MNAYRNSIVSIASFDKYCNIAFPFKAKDNKEKCENIKNMN